MTRVLAFCTLPAAQHGLVPGKYGNPARDGFRITKEKDSQRLRVSRTFAAAVESLAEEEGEKIRDTQAKRFLRDLNRLIRWFRVLSSQASINEVSLDQLGGVDFRLEDTQATWGSIQSSDQRISSDVSPKAVAKKVKRYFDKSGEPPVEVLFLLDAKEALREGRFRESILFCWSVIDATFNKTFGELVDSRLAGEWAESRAYLKGIDFPLRQKMTGGMKLLCGRSLFHEPDVFWKRLSTSYTKRNKIIHEGHSANEDEARSAITVAEEIVSKLKEVAASCPTA